MTMKNIHITPTEHTSRLYYNSQERTYQLCEFPKYHTDIKSTHNLHITSNEEGVYDKDYYLYEGSTFKARPRDEGNFKNKVILTTDQDLIKDGVQAIDDEFLEWFVKNPSCEKVDVEVIDDNIQWYKIIIPKKNFYCGDKVDYGEQCLEQCVQCVNATGVDYGYLPKEHVEFINDNIDEFDEKIKEFKQIDQNNPVTRGSTDLVYKQETLEDIKLEEVVGSRHCLYSVIENKLSALYRNQEQILKAIKMLNNGK